MNNYTCTLLYAYLYQRLFILRTRDGNLRNVIINDIQYIMYWAFDEHLKVVMAACIHR